MLRVGSSSMRYARREVGERRVETENDGPRLFRKHGNTFAGVISSQSEVC